MTVPQQEDTTWICSDGGEGGGFMGKAHARRGVANSVTILALVSSLGLLSLYVFSLPYRKSAAPTRRLHGSEEERCDLFAGEWVRDPAGPYYSNTSCASIQEHQNCMKFGRPDGGFMRWRWRPDGCELPLFDPGVFVEMMKGKSMVFVGDSLARNHLQSLICLLSRVARPVDFSEPTAENRLYIYREHKFNLSIISSPYLVRAESRVSGDLSKPFNLYLDEFDEKWTNRIREFDFIVASAGHWFSRPSYFYLNRTLVGCLYCSDANVSQLSSSYSYRRAFTTAFRAINSAENFTGVTFLRTFTPSHYEGGQWDKGGDCPRTKPFRRDEMPAVENYIEEMHSIQLEELAAAQTAAAGNGRRFLALDVTAAMLLRPDGHPSKYGRPRRVNQTFPSDCVHWCLPGPIDAWNDLLQELLKREMVHGTRYE